MALSEQQQQQLPRIVMEEDNYCEIEGSDYSDDSQDDPTYDIFEETRSCFSNLSMEKNTESRVQKEMDLGFVADLFGVEIATPVLDKKDEKSFEMVQKMIEDGELEKLKVDQCKVYLRKNGLRLTGTKDTLIQRIKEHIDIINGGGEKKYPVSSFVLNCKGDACTRDVVMFEQNVYQMFNIASRSASGPPCGTRIIAGRIVKESYGAAKQQHTFTIEVLWSKGEKPLPPLHPLLIKGRNLYRLKTLRQRWEDEGERRRVLMEKHSRGSIARADREVRIQEKEMLKNKRHLKDTRKAKPKKNDSQLNPVKLGLSVDSEKLVQPPKQQKQNSYHNQQDPPLPRKNLCPSVCKENIGVPQNMLKFSQEIQHSNHVHQSLVSSHRKDEPRNNESQLNPTQQKQSRYQDQPYPPLPRQNFFPNICKENIGFPENMLKFPEKIRHSNQHVHPRLVSSPKRDWFLADNHSHKEPLRSTNRFPPFNPSLRDYPPMAPSWRHHHPPLSSSWGHSHKQVLCRHYARGRCNFGENCKFLHDFEIGRCDSRS